MVYNPNNNFGFETSKEQDSMTTNYNPELNITDIWNNYNKDQFW